MSADDDRVLPWHHDAWDRLFRASSLPQSLLVSGAAGAGLREFGWACALRALCPVAGRGEFACGVCRACQWSRLLQHPDLLVLGEDAVPSPADAAGEAEGTKEEKAADRARIPVAEVRTLIDFFQRSSHQEHAKVALLWPADSMNLQAANALLKVLEEPPQGSHLILVSRAPSRLPATIRSRCQHLRLRRPGVREASEWVRAQGVSNPELALAQVGQAPLAARDLTSEYWQTRARVLPMLSLSPDAGKREMGMMEGVDLRHLVPLLQTWTYDLVSVYRTGRVRYHPDFEMEIRTCTRRVSRWDLLEFDLRLRDTRRRIDHALNARLVWEELLLSYFTLFDRGSR